MDSARNQGVTKMFFDGFCVQITALEKCWFIKAKTKKKKKKWEISILFYKFIALDKYSCL